MAYSELPWRPLLGHQAWSWTTLRRGNVFYYVYKRFFSSSHVFTFLNVLQILFERFYIHASNCPPRPAGFWTPVLYRVPWSQTFLHSSPACQTHRHTDHATCDMCGRGPHRCTGDSAQWKWASDGYSRPLYGSFCMPDHSLLNSLSSKFYRNMTSLAAEYDIYSPLPSTPRPVGRKWNGGECFL